MTDDPNNAIDEPRDTLPTGADDPAVDSPLPGESEGEAASPLDNLLGGEPQQDGSQQDGEESIEDKESTEDTEEDTEEGEKEETAKSDNEEAPEDASAVANEPVDMPQAEAEAQAQDEAEAQAEDEAEAEAQAEDEDEDEDESSKMDWYILKVQSNREDSIRDGLARRVKIAGLDEYFGEIIVPIEKVTEFKGGKKRVSKRKLYPGYIVVQMEINDDTWFLVRETPGIGDFTGAAGKPTPMLPHEVARILAREEEKADKAPTLKIAFSVGDRIKVTEGNFENFEGEVHTIDQIHGRVTVMINIFGRPTPVELEYWQIESV